MDLILHLCDFGRWQNSSEQSLVAIEGLGTLFEAFEGFGQIYWTLEVGMEEFDVWIWLA